MSSQTASDARLYILPAVSSQTASDARLLHSSYTHAIFIVVLAINDKHTLHVKHLPTISPFGIDGN